MEEKFVTMYCNSTNIGDEIQWVASSRFLPSISAYYNRERIEKYHPKVPTKIILNGWFTRKPTNFYLHKNINALIISFYLHRSCYKKFSTKKIRDLLLKNSPIGCRDLSTCKFLKSLDIPCYFSGCLTLTLIKNPKIKKESYILAMGLKDEELSYLRSHTTHPVWAIDRLIPQLYKADQKHLLAKAFLGLYQSAYCIVTNKLHVALPALALETPVLFINIESDDLKNDPERLEGLIELLYNVNSKDFISGNFNYNFDFPPDNKKDYIIMREKLIEKCYNFTKYDNKESLIVDNPLETILQHFTIPQKYYYDRAPYFTSVKVLLKVLFRRIIKRKDRFDVKAR